MSNQDATDKPTLISTGIAGLDFVLKGGLTSKRLHLLEGFPGTGKTTMALQFLLAGAAKGESVLYVTLSETEEELRAVAASHGWDLHGIRIHEVIASEELLDPSQQHTLFHPSEIELADTTKDITDSIEKYKPTRVVIDSLSEMRLLAANPLRYRRQVLAYKQYFSRKGITALVLDDRPDNYDMQVRSIAHGVINLDYGQADYGTIRRRMQVIKYRGINFQSGFHDYKIFRGGLVIYPRLVASETRIHVPKQKLNSGIEKLDALLGGGLDAGTSTLISGPPGTGKSTLAAQLVWAAINRGENASMFVFEESIGLLFNRTSALGIDLKSSVERGQLTIQQIDPAEMSPGEFAYAVCDAADLHNAKIIVIDSLQGYLNAMPDERFLPLHMHELLMYLGQRGVTTIMVSVQRGVIGETVSAAEASYLADNILLMRHFEFNGQMHQALSVFKMRGSQHERTIRHFSLSSAGIAVGEPLKDFHGVLSGTPTFSGKSLDNEA